MPGFHAQTLGRRCSSSLPAEITAGGDAIRPHYRILAYEGSAEPDNVVTIRR
jgi:hypothetical protein